MNKDCESWLLAQYYRKSQTTIQDAWQACADLKDKEIATLKEQMRIALPMSDVLWSRAQHIRSLIANKQANDLANFEQCARLVDEREAIRAELNTLKASLVGKILVGSEPSEEEIDSVRGFLLGLELRHKTLEGMRKHLKGIGDSIDSWPAWAQYDTGHITKAGKALIIRAMMLGAIACAQ